MCKAIAEVIVDSFKLSHDKTLKQGGGELKGNPESFFSANSGNVTGDAPVQADKRNDDISVEEEISPELARGFPEPGPTTRRKISMQEIIAVKGGRGIEGVYIGRPSTWGNPYKIGRGGSRSEVVEK